MKKFKKIVIFYSLIAVLTYALILRMENLEQYDNHLNANSIVISFW